MNWQGIEAVLFDLDGTLVDSVPDLAAAVDRMLADFGRAPAGPARVRDWVGNGAARLVKRALTGQMQAEPDPVEFERALSCFYAHYAQSLSQGSRLYPRVTEGLAALAERGLALAVVTNKPERFIEELLQALGLHEYFTVSVGGDSLVYKKPHPAPLLHAAERLGAAPAATLMVGDSRNDVEAARRAEMRVVCVPYGYNHGEPIDNAAPDAVVQDLAELARRLNER